MSEISIVCPFCPLCCDDVAAVPGRADLAVDCNRAQTLFRAAMKTSASRIGAESFDGTPGEAAQLLRRRDSERTDHRSPSVPRVEIVGPTLEEAKDLHRLRSDGRLLLVRDQDPSRNALAETIARDGSVGATLADARKHAELIWMIGQFDSFAPRLEERLRRPEVPLLRTGRLSLTDLSSIIRQCESGAACSPEDAERVRKDWSESPDSTETDPSRLAQALVAHRYVAILVGNSAFEPNAELVSAEILMRLIARRNGVASDAADPSRITRTVLVRLNDQESLEQVIRWRTNDSQPYELRANGPLIRLGSSLSDSPLPALLQIGGEDPGPELAAAYLPAGTPGIDYPATRIRGDATVTLPLTGFLRPQDHRVRRIEVLTEVLDAWSSQPESSPQA